MNNFLRITFNCSKFVIFKKSIERTFKRIQQSSVTFYYIIMKCLSLIFYNLNCYISSLSIENVHILFKKLAFFARNSNDFKTNYLLLINTYSVVFHKV